MGDFTPFKAITQRIEESSGIIWQRFEQPTIRSDQAFIQLESLWISMHRSIMHSIEYIQ